MDSSTEYTRVLAECAEAVETGRATVEECLARHPEHRAELAQVLPMIGALHRVPRVEPPAEFRAGARERLLAKLPDVHPSITEKRVLRDAESVRQWIVRRFKMAWIAAIAVIVSLVGGGGLVYAADGAAPGDVLYSLDRSIEDVRLQLTSDPAAVLDLQLALAAERLEEAEKVLGGSKAELFGEALDNYDAAVGVIAETVQSSAVADDAVLGGLLDEAIASHDVLLASLVYGEKAQEGELVQIRDQDRLRWCADLITDTHIISPTQPISNTEHPVGAALAVKYDVTYDEIMEWFCLGYGFGEINLAYRISAETGTPVGDLLDAREDMGWGQIMREAGVIGPENQGPYIQPPGLGGVGEGEGPQGPSESQGPQGLQEPQGNQEPQGAQGPGDEVGNPDAGQQAPPGDAGSENGGPPDSVPQGPPDNPGQGQDQGAGQSQGNGKP